ncbi:MAG TPA: TRAP transporter small permease [Burkholderiales bacterium]|nr:TRAP transporter small permease [Burkholderiales bacterium]
MSEPRQPLDWFDRTVVPLLGYFAAAVMFGLMLLTCVDVVGRYFLNKPVWGGFELTEMLLAALIFAGLPLVTLRDDHVTVDLFDPVIPDWLFRIQHVVACAIGFLCTGYLAWRLWLRAEQLGRAGETTAVLKIDTAWLGYAMSLLMAFTAIALIVLAFRRPHRHFVEEGSA